MADFSRDALEDLGAVGHGVPEAEIAKAEKSLGVSFPASYRAFLAACGWAEVGPLSIAGLGKKVPPDLDLLRAARSAWEEGEIPRDLLPVVDDTGGDFLFLDLSAEGAVVYLSAGERQTVAPSFEAWFEEEIAGLSEDEDEP
jgi:SMI1 / KNR4 family (SUKH-1)